MERLTISLTRIHTHKLIHTHTYIHTYVPKHIYTQTYTYSRRQTYVLTQTHKHSPATQSSHTVSAVASVPVLSDAFPGTQAVHADAPSNAYFPAHASATVSV